MAESVQVIGWQSWSYCNKDSQLLPKRYFSPFGADHQIRVGVGKITKPSISGWCSWHWFGKNINQQVITSQAEFISRNRKTFPLDYILIDDGWCKTGDWLVPDVKKFPKGMKWMAEKIRRLGFKPGIWLAPFLASYKSEIFRRHPEWLIRNDRDQIIEGTKVSVFDNLLPEKRGILDLRNSGVRSYLEKVVAEVVDWGYELIKLDFLYANHFNPDFTSPDKPDRLVEDFLEKINKPYGEIYMIASGAPLAPVIPLVDAIRISDDINFPQVRNLWPVNSIVGSARLDQLENNIKFRSELRNYVNLDPDAFVCHKSHGLSENQCLKLVRLIRKLKGLKFLGDDLSKLSKYEIDKFIRPLFSTIG